MATGLLGKRNIDLDIFTDAYRVSGRLTIGTAGVYTKLDNPSSNFLELNDAYVSRVHKPGEIIASYGAAAFRKDNINFVVLQHRRDGFATSTSRVGSVFTRGRLHEVLLTVPSFEVEGEVYLDSHVSPGALMTQTHGKYLMIFGGRAAASTKPEIAYSGDLIMVQKTQIGILCLGRDKI